MLGLGLDQDLTLVTRRKSQLDRDGKTDLHIYLSTELVDELKTIADEECRSWTMQVEYFVREGLRRWRERINGDKK